MVVYNYSATRTGYINMINGFVAVALQIALGFYIRHTKHFKNVSLYFGVPVSILGAGLMARFRSADDSIGLNIMCQVLIGLGWGTLVLGHELAAYAASDRDGIPMVYALLGLSSSVFGSVARAIVTAIYTSVFSSSLLRTLPPDTVGKYMRIMQGGSRVQMLYPVGSDTRNAIDYAYGEVQKYLCIMAAVVMVLAFPAIYIWKDYRVDRKQIPGVPRVGFPGLCLDDAGNGLRNADFVSSWPSGMHVGASWNRDLAAKRAIGIAGDFKKKGVNMILGPVVGPIGRTQLGGRVWEGLSVDPYLAGELVYETVKGSQSVGVITSTKHFVGNEQETNRWATGDIQSVSTNMDDRTMHELYIWPFQNAVLAGTGNVLCSYNRLNNSYTCANSKALNGLLKTELGFQGFVVDDWLAGTPAVQNGSVPASRVADMATRIVAAWYQMDQDTGFTESGFGMVVDLTQPHPIIDARNPADRQTLLDGAIEGHVLVKNANNVLPLKAPKFLSVFGYSAQSPTQNDYSP
ncbi:hypothetical protein SEPCBS57363_006671, partial [Sporothrix epigloea]